MGSVLVQLCVSGLAMGFIYALVGIEYMLIWNSTGLLNFSHDKIIMLGGYVFIGTFLMDFNMGFGASIAGAILTVALFGVAIALMIFIPLRNKTRLCAIIATVMLGKILNEGARLIWGPVPLQAKGFMSGSFKLGGIVLPKANVYIIIVGTLIVVGLQLFMKKTKRGKAMKCVAQNKTAATLMGINVAQNMALTIAMSFGLCTVIGILSAPLFTVSQNMATMVGLKGFAASIIGGFGFLPGAIAGGLIVGIMENLSCLVFPSTYKDVVAFVLLIIFLMFKPNGIFNKTK